MFELFEHTADLGLRVRAGDLPKLFADAARGLFTAIVTNLEQVRAAEKREVRVEGSDLAYLLCDWLSELLYLFETQHMVLAEFQVQVDLERQLVCGTAWGEPIDMERHQFEHEVKAVTYHGLKVQPADGGWLAEVILDI